MWLILLKIIGGFILLIGGGNYLVKGAIEFTKHFKVSKLVVGMTVVAFGTSAPELFVSLQAALKGSADISLGNVIGSNIANVALVLATAIIIFPLTVKKETIKFDWPIMFVSFILLWLFMLDGHLSRTEGIIFLISLTLYLWWEIRFSRQQHASGEVEMNNKEKKFSIPVAILIVLVASVALAYGSDILVDGTKDLAKIIGISERVISISVIALGTSLPELVASLIAALKKEPDISVGNIIGSNIFNIFAILCITSLIHPMNFKFNNFKPDLIWMTSIGVVLFLSFLPYKKRYIHRFKGFILLSIYAAYMILLFQK